MYHLWPSPCFCSINPTEMNGVKHPTINWILGRCGIAPLGISFLYSQSFAFCILYEEWCGPGLPYLCYLHFDIEVVVVVDAASTTSSSLYHFAWPLVAHVTIALVCKAFHWMSPRTSNTRCCPKIFSQPCAKYKIFTDSSERNLLDVRVGGVNKLQRSSIFITHNVMANLVNQWQ